MADQPTTADDVKAIVADSDIRFVRLWFTDILGQLKSFSINAAGARATRSRAAWASTARRSPASTRSRSRT